MTISKMDQKILRQVLREWADKKKSKKTLDKNELVYYECEGLSFMRKKYRKQIRRNQCERRKRKKKKLHAEKTKTARNLKEKKIFRD